MTSFQSFWHGPKLPRHVKLCMKSFVERGHRYKLYAYRRYEVPPGVEVADATEILPKSTVFYYRNPDGTKRSVAAFADLFRYALLDKAGGWWVDTDVMRLTAPLPRTELYLGWQDETSICNAILRAPPGHPLMRVAQARARSADTKTLAWGDYGPKLVTELAADLNLTAAPSEAAYPLHWRDYAQAVEARAAEETARRVSGAPFLHLWREMFRLNSDPRIDAPEPGSFLEQEYRRFGFRGARG